MLSPGTSMMEWTAHEVSSASSVRWNAFQDCLSVRTLKAIPRQSNISEEIQRYYLQYKCIDLHTCRYYCAELILGFNKASLISTRIFLTRFLSIISIKNLMF